MKNMLRDDFINFLEGNFHQDIESVDDAINEINEEESKDYLYYATEFITEFLNSDISNEDKINIIMESTALYYEDKNQYIVLIEDILKSINKKLN
ncbi:hypothetical protein [Clostridium felsineum]|uniref:hypothetical protein n=1 Tax=Clostridium felsineum TaxID=36839 RepID=UPI00098BF8D5|nr:hypothetical protein [Clostridium felsineum]URZ03972.1 hypothetical protein CLAUR_040380 [Clostridium felsineum]